MRTDRRELAVAIHDVEPGTFERVALIRDWLDDLGVGRVTLLVVPAPGPRRPADDRDELGRWLGDRRREGDAVAQLALRDRRPAAGRRQRVLARWRLRARARAAGRVLRVDLRPRDLERRDIAALEAVLARARGRRPVTLDELAEA